MLYSKCDSSNPEFSSRILEDFFGSNTTIVLPRSNRNRCVFHRRSNDDETGPLTGFLEIRPGQTRQAVHAAVAAVLLSHDRRGRPARRRGVFSSGGGGGGARVVPRGPAGKRTGAPRRRETKTKKARACLFHLVTVGNGSPADESCITAAAAAAAIATTAPQACVRVFPATGFRRRRRGASWDGQGNAER